MVRMWRTVFLLLLLGRLCAAQSGRLRVAAAADLAPAMNELKQEFEHSHQNATLSYSIGSSVQLEQQIENGAPFDVFLSADRDQPQKLVDRGLAHALFIYAQGSLVILTRRPELQNLQALRSAKRIAIANPEHAPYGRAAVEALKSAKLYDAVQSKLVQGENVAQAAQFVLSGNADAGLVSATAKPKSGKFHVYPVDPSLYSAIRQGAVLTNAGAKNWAARDFMEFMRSDGAQRILQAHGLRTPHAVYKPIAP
jgi:molybdate transport system substrate-binding protein